MRWKTLFLLTTTLMTSLPCTSFAQECCLGSYLPNRNSTWVLEGGALFFKPYENGLDYGMLTSGRDFNQAFNFMTGEGDFAFETKVRKPKFEWDTGFRIAFGYEPCCTCIAIASSWMHFKGHAKDKTEAHFVDQEGSIFIGTWTGFGNGTLNSNYNSSEGKVTTTACANFDFCLDMIDVDAGYKLCLSRCLMIVPYLGVRIGSIDQRYCLDTHSKAVGGSFPQTSIDAVRLKNKFTGAGLLFGVSSDYVLGCGFNLFGSVEAALLKGHFKLREEFHNSFDLDALAEIFTRDACQKERLHLQRTVADFKFGGSWQTCLTRCTTFVLSLAWEQHLYYGQNQFRPIAITVESGTFGIDQSNRGDLGLQGVSLTAQLIY